MSEFTFKQAKEAKNQDYFPKLGKKVANRNHQYEIQVNNSTLNSHLKKITDAVVLNFNGNQKGQYSFWITFENSVQTTNGTLRSLAKLIGSLTRVRKIEIQCQNCDLLTDEGLKALYESLKRMGSLQYLNLDFRR